MTDVKNPNKKGRRSENELVQALYELASMGMDEEAIKEELSITTQKAQSLHYRLVKEGKLSFDQLDFISSRRVCMTERGVFIPRYLFERFGLDAMFSIGTPVRLSKYENSLVIMPRNTRNVRVEKEFVQPEPSSPAIEWDDLAADEIVKGESDEPNA